MKKKTFVMILALVLVLGLAVGGTIAWLSDKTEAVINTFTAGKVDIDLTETVPDDNTAKMIPGSTIDKDPKVTVKAGSEACYVFVKIVESTDLKLSDYITYEVADGWTALTGQTGVYYRTQAATDEDVSFSVIKGDKVTVKDTVTSTMMAAITEDNAPTLTFTAYAIQKDNIADAATAWTNGGW